MSATRDREVLISRTERTILMPHEYLERYERWVRGHSSENTTRQRVRMAARVLARWPDPGRATPEEITDWLGAMGQGRARPLKPWTRATYYSDTRAFFKWLAAAGLILTNPTAGDLFTDARPSARAGIPKPLSPAEEARALGAAHGNMEAWLLLALRAGLRAHEIAGFTGESIEQDHIVLIGKGHKEAAIPTHPELWTLAQRFPRRGWWFPSPAHEGHVSADSVTILVGRHFRRPEVDIPSGSIHRARHTYATSLLRRGANMRQVQTLMRHSSPATTAIYTAVDEDELRNAINLLGPLPTGSPVSQTAPPQSA